MGQHSQGVREALLDSAEKLFAMHGIDAVSNRRIVEHAGMSNHSAVAYHFGSREELMRTLLYRHSAQMAARHEELLKDLGATPTVHDLVRCRLLPLIELLESLPRPSWHARFLAQLRNAPSAADSAGEIVAHITSESASNFGQLAAHLDAVPVGVLRARSRILSHLVLGVCAEHEGLFQQGRQQGSWMDVGYFLIDSASGMLAAGVSWAGSSFESPASLPQQGTRRTDADTG